MEKKKINIFFKKHILFFLVLFVASLVFLTNLDGQWYILDEPSTITVAKSIFTIGYPSAWDGKNLLSDTAGTDFTFINGAYVWTWHPWLQFYLVAPFIHFFGDTVAMNRLPFALFGVLTVGMLYLLSLELFKKKWIALLLSAHLIFLLPFFLYVRQVRYYSPSAFFSLLYFWLFLRLYENKWSKKLTYLFVIINVLLFFTNYLIWMSCLAVFILLALIKRNRTILVSSSILILFAVAWFFFFTPFKGNPATIYPGHEVFFVPFMKYVSYTNNYIFPLLLVPLIIFGAHKLHMMRYIVLIGLWIGLKVVLYSALLDPHGRFLMDLFPIFILTFGFMYKFLSIQRTRFLIAPLFLLLVTTNLLNVFLYGMVKPASAKVLFYPEYYRIELTGQYPNIIQEVGAYLAKNARPEDLYWSNNYAWYIYHTSDVSSFSPACDKSKKQFFGPPSVTDTNKIRWFIFFQHDVRLMTDLNKHPCFGSAWQKKLEKEYKRIEMSFPQTLYPVNDPDIVMRDFPPVEIKKGNVILYEKKY